MLLLLVFPEARQAAGLNVLDQEAGVTTEEQVAETLHWTQPRFMHEEYLLHRGQESIGSLTFRSGWGTLATGECDGVLWTFKRLGFLRTRVTVRMADSETDIAVFNPTTWSGGGTIDLPDGRQFRVDISFWHSRFVLLDPTNRAILRYRSKGVFRQGADMDILVGASAVPELTWLMLFGWYLAVLMQRDATATAG